MPAIELKSSRLKNSNHLFLILNGTSIFSRKTVPVSNNCRPPPFWPAAVASRFGGIFRD
jgi:hypothetical protein